MSAAQKLAAFIGTPISHHRPTESPSSVQELAGSVGRGQLEIES